MRNSVPRLFALLFCFILTACVYVIPIRQLQLEQTSEYSGPLPLEQAEAIERVGESYGMLYWAMSVGLPLDEEPMSVQLLFFDLDATKALLTVRLADIQRIKTPQEFNQLLDKTEKAFAAQGERALWLFSYYFHSEVVVSLADSMQRLTDAEQIRKWSRILGQHMALATDAAKKLGVSKSTVDRGNQIAYNLLSGLADRDLATVRDELSLWRTQSYSLVYLAADELIPTPTPTSQGAVGVDIKQPLPPGDSNRGEQLMLFYGCIGCHQIDKPATGQPLSGAGTKDGLSMIERAKVVLQSKEYAGTATTVEEYVFESIVQSNVFVAEGYPPNVQPQNYGETLDLKAVADLIAYIMTFQ